MDIGQIKALIESRPTVTLFCILAWAFGAVLAIVTLTPFLASDVQALGVAPHLRLALLADLTLAVSLSIFLAITKAVGADISTPRAQKARRTAQIERLGRLTADEKQILGSYVAQNRRSLRLSIEQGTPQVLEDEGFIRRTSAVGSGIRVITVAFSIEPWVFDYLKTNSHLISRQ